MRRLRGMLPVLLLMACAPKASISLSDVAGVWRMQAMPQDRDSVLVTYHLWAENGTQWKMKFDQQADTLPVRVLAVEGDSIRVQIGPYSSALRPGVSVTTFSMYRMDGDTLRGTSVAHYSVSTADSVRYIRTKGTRVR